MIQRTVVAVLALVLVANACSGAMEPLPSDVDVIVDMKEYSITLNVSSVKAGTVKFGIRNLGTMVHDFDLYRTDRPLAELPIDGGSAKVKMDGLIRQMINIAANRSTTLSVDLGAGRYVIICNVAGHYQLGMRVSLQVD